MHVRVCACVYVRVCLLRYCVVDAIAGKVSRTVHCLRIVPLITIFYNIDATLCHISIEQARYIATFDWKCEMYVMDTYYGNSLNKEDKCRALILTSNNE